MTDFLDACYDAIRIQENSISRTIEGVEEDSLSFQERRRVIFVGCGDSFAVARYGQWIFLQSGMNTLALSSPDIRRIPLDERDVVVGITASGRSIATINALQYSKRKGAYTIVLTDNPNGRVTQDADLVWQTHAGVDSYNISPSSPTTTAMVYILKRMTMEQGMLETELYKDSARLERIGKEMVDWAERTGIAISELVNLSTPLYLVSDGSNHIAAQLGLMKFNEYSLVNAHLAHREEFSHHWNLSLSEKDSVVFVTDTPSTPEDLTYLKILKETLRMKVHHLFVDEGLNLETSLAQTVANAIALQMAAYHTVMRFEPDKERWKQPNADAFSIYRNQVHDDKV
ncbi:MAG: SIS domain-containing protein [Candidatus Thorarchaeota archaeon]|jgi:DNA-binding MurR/RpiR family transcriptional regulator